ncbi:MAG: hypothetical protein ACR2F1_06580 [Nitrososphaeraceae archaeon]
MIKFNFHKYIFTLIFIGFLSIIVIELFSIQLSGFLSYGSIIQYVLAQPQSTNTSIINSNVEEQDKPKIIHLFGHFANNQIKDGIVTWIQGGLWNLNINNITNSKVNNNSTQIINNNGIANFTANFTMVKPDGSISHNHNINNFVSKDVIITDKDIVVIGTADINSDDNNNNEYKSVPLTIHLMGNKVLGLTMDVSKTKGHFSSTNEMFGTLISGIGLDASAGDSIEKTMQHDTITNNTVEKESTTMMQH